MFFCRRFCLEKPGKIEVFGIPKPSQNSLQSRSKSMSKKRVDFCYFLNDAHLSLKPSKPWKYQFSLRKITIFQFLHKLLLAIWPIFAFRKSLKKPLKITSKAWKNRVCNRLAFKHRFFRVWGSILGAFGRLLGLSWVALVVKYGAQELAHHWDKPIFFQLLSFSWRDLIFLRFGKVGKSSATKTSKLKKFEISMWFEGILSSIWEGCKFVPWATVPSIMARRNARSD